MSSASTIAITSVKQGAGTAPVVDNYKYVLPSMAVKQLLAFRVTIPSSGYKYYIKLPSGGTYIDLNQCLTLSGGATLSSGTAPTGTIRLATFNIYRVS